MADVRVSFCSLKAKRSPLDFRPANDNGVSHITYVTATKNRKNIIDGEDRHLSLRNFDDKIKRQVYEKQKHRCPYCDARKDGHTYPTAAEEFVPWSRGGKTEKENCQMLCKWHNSHKSDK